LYRAGKVFPELMAFLTDPRFVTVLKSLETEGAFDGIPLGSKEFMSRLDLAAKAFEAHTSGGATAAGPPSASSSTEAASASTTDSRAENTITEDEALAAVSWEAMDEYKARGNDLFRSKQWFAAAMAYGRALAVCPVKGPRAILLANRAAALTEASVLEEAEHDARLAVRILPTYAKAHYRLGRALEARDRRTEAVASLERSLELDPDLSGARAAIKSINASMSHTRRI
jgi:tetratricopeptide (TPR) repeat protein